MTHAPGRVIWIASYPKSGNTWVRFLVCHLVFGPVASAASLAERIPDLHELGAVPEPGPGLCFLKTHFPYGPGLPLVERTAAAIYVVRHPGDVLVSNFHYAQRRGAAAGGDAAAFDRYVDSFIACGGDPRWIKLGMGSWSENVQAWRGAGARIPLLWVPYEDLLQDTAEFARLLCARLGLTRTPEQIAAAVAGSSFERMRAIEEADIAARRTGIFYKPYLQGAIDSGLRFMRTGGAGGGTALSPEQQRRFDAVFGDLRRQVGY
jgi:hypothetical protein